jgi:CheY-like chemotaxis protein
MSFIYSLTAAGKDAAAAKDSETDFPLEYRRILGLIGAGTHVDVLRGRLRRFPDGLIDDWLKELLDLKMIEAKPAGEIEDFTFTGRPARLTPLLDEDRRHLTDKAVIAGATLLREGSYIADERIANLPALGKPPDKTLIVVVDGDPDQANLTEMRLKFVGYKVRRIDSAKLLSRSLREQGRPDLVLLDVVLPDGDGFDLLAKLRAAPEFATLPIVILTAKAKLSDIHHGLDMGADGYIAKPYSKQVLSEVIARVLKQSLSQ